MGRTKEHEELRNYIYKICDLWMALHASQKEHNRKIWPFPGFPNNKIIFISNKTQVQGLYGLANYTSKKVTGEYEMWLKKHNKLLTVDWHVVDTAYRAAHAVFCEADKKNHPMGFYSSWEHSPAWSIMTEEQTIAVEKTINQYFTINGY